MFEQAERIDKISGVLIPLSFFISLLVLWVQVAE